MIEDEPLIQSLVEETLSDGGFESAVVASGEEGRDVTRQDIRGKYRALVTDIHLRGKMDGWEVAQRAREIEPDFPRGLYERSRCGGLDIEGCPPQHHAGKAVRSGPVTHCNF